LHSPRMRNMCSPPLTDRRSRKSLQGRRSRKYSVWGMTKCNKPLSSFRRFSPWPQAEHAVNAAIATVAKTGFQRIRTTCHSSPQKTHLMPVGDNADPITGVIVTPARTIMPSSRARPVGIGGPQGIRLVNSWHWTGQFNEA